MTKLLVLLLSAALVVGAWWWLTREVPPPDVPFGPDDIDFARLEHGRPLRAQDLAKITPQNVQALSQEQVDQIYSRLTAGPIPNAAFDGDLFFPRGADRTRFAEVVGAGVAGGLKGRAADVKVASLEFLGAKLWKGKVFDRETRILRNRIADLKSLDLILDAGEEAQLQALKDEALGQYLLFPAKLYCGQSLLDGRRESIIIDYAYTDDLPGYVEKLDHLVGREGLAIRDEIRMVRPGFYLGRAYMNRVFALNFTLYNKDLAAAAESPDEDCWTGEQVRLAQG